MQQIGQKVDATVFDINKKYAQFQNVLKNAEKGKVCTRFPPEPSGYLHIGHIKAATLNYHYSKIYEGKMLLRFDDTNPSKEKVEFVDSILADLKTLGVQWSKLSYSSDHFDYLQDRARELIKLGLAYCDNTPVEKMRDERGKGIESQCRSQTIEQNLNLYEQMLQATSPDYCLRAMINMKHLNKCMRDPVLYRVNLTPHHRTGTKYKAYPTYDFCCPLIDSLEGVTHALRTNEYADRIEQYYWYFMMIKALNVRHVEMYEFSRLNFVNTCLSKRKLQQFVDEGVVEGWEDPRFPTLRGILRRGVRVETLTEFMLEQGPSKNSNLMEWDKLWANNIKIIDSICPRYSAIGLDKIATLHVVNWNSTTVDVLSVPAHQKNPELGDRPLFRSANLYMENEDAVTLKADEKVTLMKWGNVKILTVEVNQETGVVHMTAEDLPNDKDYKGTKKMSWIAQECPLVNVELVEYDHLINVKKVEEEMEWSSVVNKNSKFVTRAVAEPGVKSLQIGDFLQFERRGFFRVDNIREEAQQLIYVMIFIPDGKTKGLASIATKVDQASINQGKQEVESKSKAKKQEKKEKKKPDQKEQNPQQEQKVNQETEQRQE